jgi:uncharacterized protein (TIGR03437 family)
MLVAWFVLAPLVFATTGVTLVDGLPFRFEANQGQADPSVRFIARGQGYNLGLTTSGSALSLFDLEHRRSAIVRTRIVGANRSPVLEAIDRQSTKTNYIRGNDPAKWLRNVPSWSRVKYRQVYPGIDLVFYGSNKRLEYDFNVSPGADPSAIELEFSGAQRIRIDRSGDLVIETDAGEIRWEKPSIYQQYGSARMTVAGAFALKHGNRVAFNIGAYDRSRELVIDPTLAYASYLGGSKNDAAVSVAVDGAGALYVCGFTSSDDFPNTGGSFQPGFAGGVAQSAISGDAFVAKIDPVSGHVIYNTYLGGRGDDFAQGVAVDNTGAAIVAGYTTSPNFPVTPNAYNGKYGGAGGNNYKIFGDAFLTKLNPAGNALIYSTYFGGSQDDGALSVALDSSGAAYICGLTASPNFPTTPGSLQSKFRGAGGNILIKHGLEDVARPGVVTGDGFVAKFSPAGALVFSTYLGGSLDDAVIGIAVDAGGNIYVTGGTLSNDFPTTPGAFQPAYHGTDPKSQYLFVTGDAFVAKIDPTGSKLLYSTYLGGSRDEVGIGLTVDATGAAYVTGFTSSTNFPTTAGVISRNYKGPPTLSDLLNFMAGDVFVTKLNPAGSQIVFSTLIGGVNDDGGTSIALDPLGNIYVSGFTNSGDFPTTSDALQRTFPGMVYVEPPSGTTVFASPRPIGHGFLLKMPPDGSSILYSTFLGGTGNDRGYTSLALDNAGAAYLSGLTGSTNFPVTPNAFQPKYGGARNTNDPKGDAWVAKISGLFPPQIPVTPPPPVTPPITVTSVANAASLAKSGGVAPGEIVAIAGSGLGPAVQVAGAPDPNTGLLATSVGGATVLFDGVAAPLVNASATQLTAIVPYEIANQNSTQMKVSFNGQMSAPMTLTVAPSFPGLFSADSTGVGQALASNADSSPNSSANPANTGDIIMLNGTGEGQTDPPGVDGQIANDTLPQPVLPLSVTIGGQPAQVSAYGGAQGQPAGYLQISVQIPDGLDTGDQPVVVTVGSASSQQNLTVAVSGNPPSASPKKRKPRARAR